MTTTVVYLISVKVGTFKYIFQIDLGEKITPKSQVKIKIAIKWFDEYHKPTNRWNLNGGSL